MWLPSSIYERVPQFWLLLGLMFFSFGLYLGFEYQLIFAYLALGAGCIARSAWIYLIRSKHRSKTTLATPIQTPESVQKSDNAAAPSS